ncbi:MAG: hypothetical protein CM1200mP29_03720 [Verrucomicrobiota bacterium]|nr:MAG: hypothetical protein CM1200mP29_03720 [Verrucomicrobiota bacterium]
MPTVSGLRRRGYTPASIRSFCKTIGMTKFNSLTDVALLEHSIRQDLNDTTPRRMAVLRPLKVVITNFDENKVEELDAANHPKDPDAGTARCRSRARFTLRGTTSWRSHQRNFSDSVRGGK